MFIKTTVCNILLVSKTISITPFYILFVLIVTITPKYVHVLYHKKFQFIYTILHNMQSN